MKYLLSPLLFILLFTFNTFTSNTTKWVREHHLVRSGDRTPGIEETIVLEANKAGINPNVALTVGWCESGLDPYARNPKSTAKGVYQFLSGTWENYCEGDVFDYKSNVKCFTKYFKTNPGWWGKCL